MLTGPYVSAAHVVELDLAGVSKGHAQILLSLPGGRQVRLDREAFEARPSGDAMWRGRSAQYANSEAVITIKNGLIVGRITLDNEAYIIRPSANGKHQLEKLDTDAFPDCDSGAGEVVAGEEMPGTTEFFNAESSDGSAPVTIDLLSVYTSRVSDRLGGDAAAEALIQAAVDNANASFANSGMNLVYRLVHTEQVRYTTAGTITNDLYWVAEDSNVAALRDKYAADMVSIIVDTTSSCGTGYVQRSPGPGFASYAFQATDMDCAVGNLTFAHEHGHNMGMEHNMENSSVGNNPAAASYDFSFAHYEDGSYRTVMSYSSQCSEGCTRVTRHSNPEGIYAATTTGIAGEQDNAQTGSLTAPIVSTFRSAADTGGGNLAPQAAFSVATADLSAAFTDDSGDADGSITNWAWEFGDGFTSSSQSPTHLYATTGTYTASLQVMDDQGATSTSSKSLAVNEPTEPVPAVPTAPYSFSKSVQQAGRGKKKTITSITLSWSHEFANVDYFVLQGCLESTTGKGKNRVVSCEWSEMLSAITPESSSVSAPTLEADYRYRIKAVNDIGSSPWSNEVKI
jgi:PKD repeat protein